MTLIHGAVEVNRCYAHIRLQKYILAYSSTIAPCGFIARQLTTAEVHPAVLITITPSGLITPRKPEHVRGAAD